MRPPRHLAGGSRGDTAIEPTLSEGRHRNKWPGQTPIQSASSTSCSRRPSRNKASDISTSSPEHDFKIRTGSTARCSRDGAAAKNLACPSSPPASRLLGEPETSPAGAARQDAAFKGLNSRAAARLDLRVSTLADAGRLEKGRPLLSVLDQDLRPARAFSRSRCRTRSSHRRGGRYPQPMASSSFTGPHGIRQDHPASTLPSNPQHRRVPAPPGRDPGSNYEIDGVMQCPVNMAAWPCTFARRAAELF